MRIDGPNRPGRRRWVERGRGWRRRAWRRGRRQPSARRIRSGVLVARPGARRLLGRRLSRCGLSTSGWRRWWRLWRGWRRWDLAAESGAPMGPRSAAHGRARAAKLVRCTRAAARIRPESAPRSPTEAQCPTGWSRATCPFSAGPGCVAPTCARSRSVWASRHQRRAAPRPPTLCLPAGVCLSSGCGLVSGGEVLCVSAVTIPSRAQPGRPRRQCSQS